MHWTADLYAYAHKHRGVFALRWAPQIGTTSKAVLAKATREGWSKPYQGVVVVPGTPWDHLTNLAAAQAAVPALAAARGQSAAWMYGLVPQPPARPQLLLLPHSYQTRLPVGLTRRSRHLMPDDVVVKDRVTTLTPTFWLISTAGDNDHRLLSFAIDARQRRLIDIPTVATRLESMPRVAGRARLMRVLQRLSHDGSDSMFESEVRDRLFESSLSQVPHRCR